MSDADLCDDEACPFDTILNRLPYLVLPKLAIQVMPMEWRRRLAALLDEAEAAGLRTQTYLLFRDGDDEFTRARVVNEATGFVRLVRGRSDPWADYRHGEQEKVRALCPDFDPNRDPQRRAAPERTP